MRIWADGAHAHPCARRGPAGASAVPCLEPVTALLPLFSRPQARVWPHPSLHSRELRTSKGLRPWPAPTPIRHRLGPFPLHLLRWPQGFPIPPSLAPEQVPGRGHLNIFCLPPTSWRSARRLQETPEALSLPAKESAHAPSLICSPIKRPCHWPGHRTDTRVLPLFPHFWSAGGFVCLTAPWAHKLPLSTCALPGAGGPR